MARRRRCGACPKWMGGYCPIKAMVMLGSAPACDYGRKLMYNAYMAEYMRRRHGYKTRKEQRHDEGVSGHTDRA